MNKCSMALYGFVVAIALMLSGCGGGGGEASACSAAAQAFTLTGKLSGSTLSNFSSSPCKTGEIILNAGQELELDASSAVTWTIKSGTTVNVAAAGTINLNGMTITHKTLNPTIWSATIGGTSSTAQASTQTFQVVATLVSDTTKTATVNVTVHLGAAPSVCSTGSSPWFMASCGGLGNSNITSLAISPTNPQVIYAGFTNFFGANSGVYKSVDGGKSWKEISSGLPTATFNPYLIVSVALDPSDTQVVYAGIDGSGVFKSTNGGTAWTAVNTGITANAMTFINHLVVDPVNSQVVYVATPDGVFKTANGGASWSPILSGAIDTVAIDPVNTSVLYAGSSGDVPAAVLKSSDGGANWSPMNAGLNNTVDKAYRVIAIDPVNTQVAYLGTKGGALYKTVNGGADWSPISAVTTTSYAILDIAISRSNPQIVYVGTAAGTWSGLYKTTDAGANWTLFGSGDGLPFEGIPSLAIDPGNSQVVYVGTLANGPYKTVTGGQ